MPQILLQLDKETDDRIKIFQKVTTLSSKADATLIALKEGLDKILDEIENGL